MVDSDGRMVGIITETDLLKLVAEGIQGEPPTEATVAEYMTSDVVTVPPTVDIYYIAGMFLANKFRRLPVVEGGKIVGAITRYDLLRIIRTLSDTALTIQEKLQSNRWDQRVGGGNRPSTASIARPTANSDWSLFSGPSSSIDTGSPPGERPAGNTKPGIPDVLPGEMFLAIAISNVIGLPPISTMMSSPIGGAGIIVAGNTMATMSLSRKYARIASFSAGR